MARANPVPPDVPPDIEDHFVAGGYRTTYANFVKCPQWRCGSSIRVLLLEGQKMSVLVDEQSRSEMLNRLKRAEGQLRGIQRMIESGQPGIDIASQLVAVRRALDSTYVHMTVSLVEQELGSRLGGDARGRKQIGEVLGELTALLAKVR
jgi:CsoR family transcriptional regulator, copper-sensing transcriptional repressor